MFCSRNIKNAWIYRSWNVYNWDARRRENSIYLLIHNLFTTCRIVNVNIDSIIFDIWLDKTLVLSLPKNFVIIIGNAVFDESHKPIET